MCECTLIADGQFEPITIKASNMSFVYRDARGLERTLIKRFTMDITINTATVYEVRNDDGDIVGYNFEVRA